MANQFKSSKVYPISAEGLLAIMTSEEYQVSNIESQPQNKSGKYVELSRDDKKMEFRIDTVEWAKKMTGALDKTKTEDTYTITTWNLEEMNAKWEYFGAQKQAKVWGTIDIVPKGNEAEMTNTFNIEISIPVISGKIEKIVIKEVGKHWPAYEEKVMEFINK